MAGPGEKSHGLAHVLDATRYSLSGLKRLFRETAFRLELLYVGLVLIALVSAGAGLSTLATSLIIGLALFAAEALNTAIEEIVDRISPEFSETAKHAKDLGSFAVFCLLAAFGVHGAVNLGSLLSLWP